MHTTHRRPWPLLELGGDAARVVRPLDRPRTVRQMLLAAALVLVPASAFMWMSAPSLETRQWLTSAAQGMTAPAEQMASWGRPVVATSTPTPRGGVDGGGTPLDGGGVPLAAPGADEPRDGGQDPAGLR